MEKRTCVVCQGLFAPKSRNQKTCCKECAEIAKKQYQYTYRKEHRAEEDGAAERKTPQERMELLSKHAREAQKMRLSYGQYMARKRMEAK